MAQLKKFTLETVGVGDTELFEMDFDHLDQKSSLQQKYGQTDEGLGILRSSS